MPNDKIRVHGNVEYTFTRRRYSNRTFTWLHWRKADTGPCNWNAYGDPWPSVRIGKKDLTQALETIAQITEEEVR